MRILLLVFAINTLFLLAYGLLKPSTASMSGGEPELGARLFKKNCSGCHSNGQNLIKADKPIIGSKEIRAKVVFKAFIENPPKPMPKFKNITDNPEQLDALYRYVISLKEK